MRPGTVDVDVHAVLGGGWHDLRPYLAVGFVHQLEGRVEHFGEKPRTQAGRDARGDPNYVCEHWLKRHAIGSAVLIAPGTLDAVEVSSPSENAELTRARNDHIISEWLPVDRRFFFAIGASSRDASAGAAEVRRLSDHPHAVAVLLPLLNLPIGDPHYRPILEAAADCELPIVIHPGPLCGRQGEPVFANGQLPAPGRTEALSAQIAMAHVVSLVFDGTLALYPRLKFVFSGWGYSWLAHLVLRMDREWRSLRSEAPWVTELPSELIRRRMRFTIHPQENPERIEDLEAIGRIIHGEDTLLFGSGFPDEAAAYETPSIGCLPSRLADSVLVRCALSTFERLERTVEQLA